MAIDISKLEKLNFLSDNAYHFEIENLPFFSAFSQNFELPGVTLGRAFQPTPLVDIPHPGDKLEFEDIIVQFIVDEDMRNYKEIHKWIFHLGYPQNTLQYKNLVEQNSPYIRTQDIVVGMLTNKYNVASYVTFVGAFPINLTGVQFSYNNPQVDHPIATATFAYSYYSFSDDTTF